MIPLLRNDNHTGLYLLTLQAIFRASQGLSKKASYYERNFVTCLPCLTDTTEHGGRMCLPCTRQGLGVRAASPQGHTAKAWRDGGGGTAHLTQPPLGEARVGAGAPSNPPWGEADTVILKMIAYVDQWK